MFYTLDRIEDNNIAVLCDDDGRIYNVPANILSSVSAGDVFVCKDGTYIFDADETSSRREKIAQKKSKFFSKIKNRTKEDIL